MKKLTVILLVVALMVGIAGCGGSNNNDKMRSLVQGNIDAIYRGKVTNEYLELVGTTAEEEKDAWLSGLNTEAEFFCYYFGIVESEYDESYDDVSDEIKERIIEMYKQIYDKAKFETKESVKQSDGSYTVQVIIEPIDIMEQASDAILSGNYAPYNEFSEKYSNVDTDSLTDAELDALIDEYTTDYANVIIDCVSSFIPSIGYKDAKSISVQIQPDSDGIFSINNDDWTKIDDYMIYYP